VCILNELKKWLELNRPRVDKGGLTGKAMTYLHHQWEKQMVYSTDGRLRLSNILAENAIRPFAVVPIHPQALMPVQSITA
jgi:transposase